MNDEQRLVTEAMSAADGNPHDVEAQIAAAWPTTATGPKRTPSAITTRLGRSAFRRPNEADFSSENGSTLRNVGRVEESIAIHTQAMADYPDFAPHEAFLALALNAAGHHDAAVAAALGALITAGVDNLDGYERALNHYRVALTAE